MFIDIIKILIPTGTAFIIGILITPVLTHYLYKYRAWKKTPGKQALNGKDAVEFNKLHKEKEGRTPRMGGIVIWGSVLLTTIFLFVISRTFPGALISEIDFLSRSQTWIPLATLFIGALVGFLNDFYDITHTGRGIRLRTRLLLVVVLATLIGWWFYAKLGVTSVGIPYGGSFEIDMLIIPFFVLIALGLYASGVIDGIDGLSGGVFASIFTAYAGVAFVQQQFDLAALSATIAGAILAFLWFNIPPARFWMTETGSMALTLTLAVIALSTDNLGEGHGIALLPIIGLPLVVTVLSNIIQMLSLKFRKKKVFRIAPLHHHFEAIGWPGYKVTMRYWVISIICAIIGLLIAATA